LIRNLVKMGRMQKKGQKGEITQYISRNQAIKKLQVGLKDFRRLCILKGVYPREPKKKFGHKTKVYYHIKDIKYLLHDDLLDKFRAITHQMKKIKRATVRREKDIAEHLEKNMPSYSLNHIIKQRYPSFVDALRDLDDALALLSLFASFPAHNLFDIPKDLIQECQRSTRDFLFYCSHKKCLRKVFLSIKGIYYQVEIMGQSITWLTPYKYTQKLVDDVDYKVMSTFLEFYRVLIKFVNFKLFNSIGLDYPMKDVPLVEDLPLFPMENHLEKINFEGIAGDDYDVEKEFEGDLQQEMEHKKNTKLFDGLVFFMNRETPKFSLEFVIRSFGGSIGWEDSDSPYTVESKEITHHILDRNVIRDQKESREYIQPQWVYDCINANILLPVADYAVGVALPSHLSPFVDSGKEGYKPTREQELEQLKDGSAPTKEDEEMDGDEEAEVMDESSEEEVDDGEDSEEEEMKELEKNAIKKASKKKQEKAQANDLSQTVMTKKVRRVYGRMMHGIEKKKEEAQKLKTKREKIEGKKQKTKGKKN